MLRLIGRSKTKKEPKAPKPKEEVKRKPVKEPSPARHRPVAGPSELEIAKADALRKTHVPTEKGLPSFAEFGTKDMLMYESDDDEDEPAKEPESEPTLKGGLMVPGQEDRRGRGRHSAGSGSAYSRTPSPQLMPPSRDPSPMGRAPSPHISPLRERPHSYDQYHYSPQHATGQNLGSYYQDRPAADSAWRASSYGQFRVQSRACLSSADHLCQTLMDRKQHPTLTTNQLLAIRKTITRPRTLPATTTERHMEAIPTALLLRCRHILLLLPCMTLTGNRFNRRRTGMTFSHSTRRRQANDTTARPAMLISEHNPTTHIMATRQALLITLHLNLLLWLTKLGLGVLKPMKTRGRVSTLRQTHGRTRRQDTRHRITSLSRRDKLPLLNRMPITTDPTPSILERPTITLLRFLQLLITSRPVRPNTSYVPSNGIPRPWIKKFGGGRTLCSPTPGHARKNTMSGHNELVATPIMPSQILDINKRLSLLTDNSNSNIHSKVASKFPVQTPADEWRA